MNSLRFLVLVSLLVCQSALPAWKCPLLFAEYPDTTPRLEERIPTIAVADLRTAQAVQSFARRESLHPSAIARALELAADSQNPIWQPSDGLAKLSAIEVLALNLRSYHPPAAPRIGPSLDGLPNAEEGLDRLKKLIPDPEALRQIASRCLRDLAWYPRILGDSANWHSKILQYAYDYGEGEKGIDRLFRALAAELGAQHDEQLYSIFTELFPSYESPSMPTRKDTRPKENLAAATAQLAYVVKMADEDHRSWMALSFSEQAIQATAQLLKAHDIELCVNDVQTPFWSLRPVVYFSVKLGDKRKKDRDQTVASDIVAAFLAVVEKGEFRPSRSVENDAPVALILDQLKSAGMIAEGNRPDTRQSGTTRVDSIEVTGFTGELLIKVIALQRAKLVASARSLSEKRNTLPFPAHTEPAAVQQAMAELTAQGILTELYFEDTRQPSVANATGLRLKRIEPVASPKPVVTPTPAEVRSISRPPGAMNQIGVPIGWETDLVDRVMHLERSSLRAFLREWVQSEDLVDWATGQINGDTQSAIRVLEVLQAKVSAELGSNSVYVRYVARLGANIADTPGGMRVSQIARRDLPVLPERVPFFE